MMYLSSYTQMTLYKSLFYETCYYSVGYGLNYINSVIHTNRNVDLVLTVQRIHMFLSDANEISTKRFTKWNWLIVLLIFVAIATVIITFIIYFCYALQVPLYYLITGSTVIFDINIIYTVRLLKLLEIEVELWNDKALKAEDLEERDIMYDEKLYNQKLFYAFVDIMESFQILKTSYRYLVRFVFITK